ncbi:MAG: hypothetical protein R3279_09145 [Putridiphycobacter sp.]|nr:hypothetical protein [Putridiphycobacter sp.]
MDLKKYSFYCPKCNHQLDESGSIHLKSERQNGDKGDMYLSTTFGTYAYKHVPEVVFQKNEVVDFFCPACHANLQSEAYPEYTIMTMRVEEKFDFEILFSRQAGMHKTYIVTEDGVESYGEHASNKLD